MSLMTSRRFAPLFWCQFFSVLNDNFLKSSLVFLIMFKLGAGQGDALITIATAVLMAPYFLLSGLGGELADRYDKAAVAAWLKLIELGAAALAAVGFAIHSVPLMFFALFLFGVIGALFSPIKYGILPDHLTREQLPGGNALVEGGTFTAIVLGGIIAGFAAKDGGSPWAFGVMMMVFAWACWQSARLIPGTGEAAPTLQVNANIVQSTMDLLKDLWSDQRLWWGGWTTSWFWTAGAIVISLLPSLVDTVNGVDQVFTAYLTLFAIAIAIGSALAAWLAHGRLVLLPAVVGAAMIGIFALDLGWVAYSAVVPMGDKVTVTAVFSSWLGWRIAMGLMGLAIGGGLFVVPVFAAVQAWAAPERRARVIAAVNVLNAGYMVAGSLFVGFLQSLGLKTSGVFIGLGVVGIAMTYVVARTMPANWIRDLLSIIFRTFYRLEVHGAENLTKAGPNTIIALNHVSFLDASLAMSLIDYDPVFAIDSEIAKRWWVKPFLRFTRAIPLDPTRPMATRTLINAVKAGETLIIFPEGRLTVTGSLMKVYDGAGLIADKSDATVVPVHIDGLEATPFTRLKPEQVRRRWFPKVTVTVLEPVKLTVPPELRGKRRRQAAGAALYGVMSDLVFRTTCTDRTVFQAVVAAAAKHGNGRVAVEDALTGTLTYKRLLIGAAVLGAKLKPLAATGETVGVMLPNANAAAVTVLGLMSAGRVPAMINFTAGVANILAACKASQAKVIVTARSFIEKGKLGALVEQLGREVRIIYLEDVRATVTFADKLRGMLQARKPLVARKADDPAVILFTSGSEGTPKGVVLSHRNQLANAAQAAARIDFGRTDVVFNVLPVFHSFGLTVGLVMPLVSGRAPVPLSLAAALPHRARIGLLLQRHHHVRHRHVPCRICARGERLRLPLAALHPRRCRSGEGDHAPHLSGEIRHAHPGRVWRHRDRAGAGAEYADVQPLRHGRAESCRA